MIHGFVSSDAKALCILLQLPVCGITERSGAAIRQCATCPGSPAIAINVTRRRMRCRKVADNAAAKTSPVWVRGRCEEPKLGDSFVSPEEIAAKPSPPRTNHRTPVEPSEAKIRVGPQRGCACRARHVIFLRCRFRRTA